MNPILFKLFIVFLQIGFFSIGGGYAVIPLIKIQMVDILHWLTTRQFTDIITISQMTPGPLAVNTSTFVGLQTGGIIGAVAATLGCILPGFVISLFLLHFFSRYKDSLYSAAILKGLRAASVGLIAAAAATIFAMAFSPGQTNVLSMLLCAVLFAALRKFKLSPIPVMIVSGIVGFLLYA